MEKRNAVPLFGNWEENAHYTTYFEKARPSNNNGPQPNPNQMAADLNKKLPPAAARDPNADLRRRIDPPRPRSSSSQRSTASEPPQGPVRGQRQSAVSWRNTNRDEIGEVRQSDFSRQNHGGGRGSRQVAAPVRNLPYYEYQGYRYGSAPATPQYGYGGAPEEMMPMHKGSVPQFGVWNANDSAVDTNFTQVFDQVKGKKLEKDKAKQPMATPTPTPPPPPPQQRKQQQQIFMHEKPRPTPPPQHKPTFLPEVPPRRVSTPSPSYDLRNAAPKDKKSSARCWPFRFSFK